MCECGLVIWPLVYGPIMTKVAHPWYVYMYIYLYIYIVNDGFNKMLGISW